MKKLIQENGTALIHDAFDLTFDESIYKKGENL